MAWGEVRDPSNNYYYWNQASNEVSWMIPGSQWRKYFDSASSKSFYSAPNGTVVWELPPGLVVPSPQGEKAVASVIPVRAALPSVASVGVAAVTPSSSPGYGHGGMQRPMGPAVSAPSSTPPPLSASVVSPAPDTPSSKPVFPAPDTPSHKQALVAASLAINLAKRHQEEAKVSKVDLQSPASHEPSTPKSLASSNTPSRLTLSHSSSERIISNSGPRTPSPATPGPSSPTASGEGLNSVAKAEQPAEESFEKEGWLTKKSPTGLKGFRQWQKRYFVLGRKTLEYSHQKGEPTIGMIALVDIINSEFLPKKRMGCRFDIKVKSNRVYAMNAETPQEAKVWSALIKKAAIKAKEGEKVVLNSQKSGLSELSKLQQIFAKARFGRGIHKDMHLSSEEEEKIVTIMKKEFPSDRKVLQWLLENVMNPKKGNWIWDVRDDNLMGEEYKRRDVLKVTPEAMSGAGAGFCDTKDCKYYALPPHRFCVPHCNAVSPDPEKLSVPDRLIAMLKAQDFVRSLVTVFSKTDYGAHDLAIRVLWILFRGLEDREEAIKRFTEYITIHCSQANFRTESRKSLLAILLSEPWVVPLLHTEEHRVAFYNPVRNAAVWTALFTCMVESPFEERKAALEDVNTVLHDNIANASSLSTIPDWQKLVFLLLTDIPKDRDDGVVKQLFAYCVNVLTMVHFEYFMQSPEFPNIITDSITKLYQFAGGTMEAAQVGTIIFTSLASKLAAQKAMFHSSDVASIEWANLRAMYAIARKYTFCTSYFNSLSEIEDESSGDIDKSVRMSMSPNMRKEDLKKRGEGKWVLMRCRLGKSETKNFADEPDIKELGLHWGADGSASDAQLAERMLKLYSALGLTVVDDQLKGQISKEEKDYLKIAVKEYKFWEDAKKFCDMVPRSNIDETLTNRRLSYIIQSWLAGGLSKKARKAVLNEIEGLIAKQEKRRDKAEKVAAREASSIAPPASPRAAATSLRQSNRAAREESAGGERSGGAVFFPSHTPPSPSALPSSPPRTQSSGPPPTPTHGAVPLFIPPAARSAGFPPPPSPLPPQGAGRAAPITPSTPIRGAMVFPPPPPSGGPK